jgi:hypothetical protein
MDLIIHQDGLTTDRTGLILNSKLPEIKYTGKVLNQTNAVRNQTGYILQAIHY